MLKMKYVILSVVAILLFSGLAIASPECTPPEMITEKIDCKLIKPVDTVVGDLVTINCTKDEKVKNRWVEIGPLNARVSVTGYDNEDTPLQSAYGDLNEGEFTFIPRIAGSYLIKVGNDAQIVLEVGENPEAYETPTAAVVTAPPKEEPELPEPEVVEEPEPQVEEPGLLDFMVNGVGEEERKGGVSGLMLMLVSLLIS